MDIVDCTGVYILFNVVMFIIVAISIGQSLASTKLGIIPKNLQPYETAGSMLLFPVHQRLSTQG